MSKHNDVTEIPDDSRVGTALFTRLQLWTIVGEDNWLREWDRQVQAASPNRTCCEDS
jgi:hypothetical protein